MILRSVLSCALSFCAIADKILLLVKRLAKKLSQLGVNRLRIIVTQETQTGVDLFLQQNAVRFGKTRQHLNEQRQQIRPFRNTARFAQGAAHPAPARPSHPIGKRGHPLDCAVDFIGD